MTRRIFKVLGGFVGGLFSIGAIAYTSVFILSPYLPLISIQLAKYGLIIVASVFCVLLYAIYHLPIYSLWTKTTTRAWDVGIAIGLCLLIIIIFLSFANGRGERPTDAVIKSSMNSARAHAELYFEEHSSSYINFCENSGANGFIVIQKQILERSEQTAICFDSHDSYAIETPLKRAGGYYCVDNTGSVMTTPGSTIGKSDYVCGNREDDDLKSLGETMPITNAESSLITLDYGYAKDEESVYYETKIIKGADPETFEVLGTAGCGEPYAKDREHVYRYTTILKNFDPNTFNLSDVPVAFEC